MLVIWLKKGGGVGVVSTDYVDQLVQSYMSLNT